MSFEPNSSEASPLLGQTRERRRETHFLFPSIDSLKSSHIRLGHDPHPQPPGTASTYLYEQPSFKALAYEDTAIANQPRPVTPAHLDSAAPTAQGVHFPTRFKLYVHLNGHCYLGQHRSALLYRIAVSRPNVALYNGLKTRDPIIGRIAHRSRHRKARPSDEVLLPSGRIHIETEGQSSLGRFTVEVAAPDGAGTRQESFRWRFTRGPAVRPLGRHSGLELVRLATDVAGSGHMEPGGCEIVAVLAVCGLRRRRTATFQFLGSGAQGLLGSQWEAVAVMTAIGLWDKHEARRKCA